MALHMADQLEEWIKTGDLGAIETFCRTLKDVNQVLVNEDEVGLNILHLVTGFDSNKRDEIIKMLFRSFTQLDINRPSGLGNNFFTPSHFAACSGYSTTLRLLLELGADPYLVDSQKLNVIEIASAYDNFNCILVVEKYFESQKPPELKRPIYSWEPFSQALTKIDEDLSGQSNPIKNEQRQLRAIKEEPVISSPFKSRSSSFQEDDKCIIVEDPEYNFKIKFEKCQNDTFKCQESEEEEDTFDVDPSVENMNPQLIRQKLIEFNYNPGPVNKFTIDIYRIRLTKLIRGKHKSTQNIKQELFLPNHSKFINDLICNRFDDAKAIALEKKFVKELKDFNFKKLFYYNYILLDPRIQEEGQDLDFVSFIKSIFYIGKGTKNRPFEHLYEGILSKNQTRKGDKINEIWKSGRGVVPHTFFTGKSEEEALQRESFMIGAFGLKNLTNKMEGVKWKKKKLSLREEEKEMLGAFFLYRAFQILRLNGATEIKKCEF